MGTVSTMIQGMTMRLDLPSFKKKLTLSCSSVDLSCNESCCKQASMGFMLDFSIVRDCCVQENLAMTMMALLEVHHELHAQVQPS
mmetsp:Transcript_33993/g.47358  ORF Transcript_33993/g.47358 Transcript_33993/m.47358 type:complete len:85 (-) Transcript_33993:62-316(-)